MIRAINSEDVLKIAAQPKQVDQQSYVDQMVKAGYVSNAFTYTEDGKPKACMGMQEYWKGRATIWAIIGDVSNWTAFHKQTKKLLEDYAERLDVVRLEMTTEVGFVESERWAKMLGFAFESEMTNFGMDGKNHKMWVRLWQQQYHS